MSEFTAMSKYANRTVEGDDNTNLLQQRKGSIIGP
jgi:hypothetical protein